MKTIDNWGIMSWEETLVMRKTSDSSLSEIFIEMDRPFCICTNPRIVTPIGTSNKPIKTPKTKIPKIAGKTKTKLTSKLTSK